MALLGPQVKGVVRVDMVLVFGQVLAQVQSAALVLGVHWLEIFDNWTAS